MSGRADWIGVDQVAEQLGYSRREAWELVKRLGVRCVGPTRGVMSRARFLRSDFDDALVRSLAPAGGVEPEPGPEIDPKAEPRTTQSRRRRGAAPEGGPDHLPRGSWKTVLAGRRHP
ncbi:hypothetical protein AB1L88_15860 [Tautonia sp. JC769]|uniref:hypothetical protein n=1 Tax=Tautonia sp. JC769 TaxID=3232135 RepID=UPI00345A6FE1